MAISLDDLIKLLVAVAAGGAIGLERELHHKAAGFRTITLICVGATLFTMLDIRIAGAGRIAANIVTGIGFLGAGVILHESNRVKGLTTAAAVWLSAALGMGIGVGAYALSLVTVGVVLVVVSIFARFEQVVDSWWDMRHYQITLPCDFQIFDELEAQIHSCGLRVGLVQRMKRDGLMVCSWNVSGSTPKQNQFVEWALANPAVRDLQW